MPPRSKRAARALAHLPEADPALAALALWCRTEDSPQATRTSGAAIHVGPEFPNLPLREQVGLIGHHILHIALRHEARMGALSLRFGPGFDAIRFNLAADALVNECLEQGGHALPRPAVTLSSLLAEVLGAEPEDALAHWDVERLYTALSDQSADKAARENSYRQDRSFQMDLAPAETDPTGPDAADWQGHITRAAQTTGASGRGIGRLLSHLSDGAVTQTPWDILLRRLLSQAVAEHPRQSYRRPKRAWIAAEADARSNKGPAPVFEPGHSRDGRRPRIVVGIDSSGSISDAMLTLFAGEVTGVARRTGAEVHVLFFDETVYRHDVLSTTTWDLSHKTVRRAGGTSFTDVLDRAAALTPSIAVILTDLDGGFGPAPAFRVVWATPLANWSPPPFGRVLSLAR